MLTYSDDHYAAEWQHCLQATSEPAIALVQQLALTHQQTLAAHFYEHMLQDPVACSLLDSEQVQQRLHASMCEWITQVFCASMQSDLAALVARQKHIGEVHARVGIPIHVVLRGARALKERFYALLPHSSPQGTAELISRTMALSMEIMGQSYAISHDDQSQAKEAYRHFALAQDVSNERERRRSNLLDWENQVMFSQATGHHSTHMPRLNQSEFGLWFRYKGAHVFQGAPECEGILQAMQEVDKQHLPSMEKADISVPDRLQQLHALRDHTRRIAFLLDTLFEQSTTLESGRDVLTRLLNRKFLPVVFNKEVHYARQHNHSFAVLAIDIDHFKSVNDRFGHEAGDAVLQQVAALLTQQSRGGDYLFRLGGEEFAMLLVDADAEQARRTADRIRQQVAQTPMQLPQLPPLHVTISIGVAAFDGHPDHQLLLRRADAALYQAKHRGRNCVAVAD